jgi:membrane-bound inhibitor of C-type lysozyme
MQARWKQIMLGMAILGSSTFAAATDLTIHLSGTQPLARRTIQYQCDSRGVSMGLPAGIFPVQYINGAGNSLVIVPVNRTSLIFANIMSGSGARYAAGQYIWWEAAGNVTFYSDSLAGKTLSVCHRIHTA